MRFSCLALLTIVADRIVGAGKCRRRRGRGGIWGALAVGLHLAAPAGYAAAITWGNPVTISGDTDVYTNGTAQYAYYQGSGNQTINGVTFTPSSAVTPWGNVSFSAGFSTVYTAYTAATAPFSALSTAYKTVLQGGDYGAAPGTVTLSGLTVGHAYAVQIWLSDPRSAGVGRSETVSSPGGNAVTLTYNSTGAVGGVGQYVVGFFVANSTNQAFTCTGPALQFNAINVRDNGAYVYATTRLNLAKYQRVITDSTNGPSPPAEVTDGLVDDDSCWVSGNTAPHWAEVVFPFPVTVGSAQLAMGLNGGSPLTIFSMQYFTNGTWVTVPGTTVAGNTNVERNLVFTNPVTATAFRVYDALDSPIRLRELALYPPGPTNGYPFGTDFSIDLARKRPTYGTTNTAGGYPLLASDGRVSAASAWQTTLVGSNALLINLQFTNKIGSAHLYSGATGVAPLADFVLQYWTGSGWATIPGGSVTGNTSGALVIPFTTPVTTTEVQLVFTNAGVSAVQELEVFPANSNGGYPLGTGVVSNTPSAAKYDTYTDSFYYLKSAAAGLAVVESNGVPVLGAGGLPNWATQYQVLLNYDNGTYRLRNRATGWCLSGAQLTTNAGALLTDEVYTALPDQDWFLQTADGTNYYLVNQYSGLVLDTQSGSTAAGTQLIQNGMTNTPTQLWQLAPATIYPKKGVAGTGTWPALFNAKWCYNWGSNPGATMATNVPFEPMSWSIWAGSTLSNNIAHIYSTLRTNSASIYVMGYNEPDQVGQANVDSTTGANAWATLQNLDMPLAAPGCANVNGAWLPAFLNLITNWGLRADYVPAHEYLSPAGGSSSCWINPLQTAYNNYGIPMWMTEFDNVDWSGTNDGQVWTEEDNYNALAEFVWRAESVTWLRKYSLYIWTADAVSYPMAPTPWTPNVAHATAPPVSHALDTNGVLTPLGELYAAWDEDATVETNKLYFLHNSSTRKRLANTFGSTSPNAQSILVRDSSAQWTLVAAGGTNLYYIVSAGDGRRLSFVSGGSVSLVAPGTTGPAVQWSLAPYQYGWYYLQHPATGLELSLAYNNSTFTATYSMVTNTTTGTAVQWRCIMPLAPIPWTGGTNADWNSLGNWNSGQVPTVGQPVVFNSQATSNLSAVLNSNIPVYVSTITVTTPAGPVSIGGTNLLTVGSGIDLSGASQNLTVTAPVRLGGGQPVTINFTVTNARTLSVNGGVSDFGNTALNVAGGGTVTLGGPVNYAGGTTINASTLTIGGAGQLGGGNFAQAITNNGIFSYNSSTNQTLSGIISGTGSVAVSGAGTLTLAGVNNYTGNTTVNSGTLAIATNGELYSAGYIYTPTVLVSTGATLRVGAWAYAYAGSVGYLDFGAARLVVNGGTITYGGSGENSGFNSGRLFTVGSGGATLNAAGTGTWFLENNATYGTQSIGAGLTLNLTGAGNGRFDNALTGGGAVAKSGPGTWTLASTNTYLGPTTISAGTLALSGSGALASDTISVAGGATFDVSGKTTPFALGVGSTLTNTSAGAVLNGTNNCSAGTLALWFDGANPAFIQTNGAMTLSAGTVMKVNNTGSPLTAGNYPLIAAATAGNPGKVMGSLPAVTVTGNGTAGSASLRTNGSGGLDLVVSNSISSLPASLGFQLGTGTLTLTWPGDHLGWIAQSNGLDLANSNYWFDILGSQSATNLVIPINAGTAKVFYRLRYPQ